MLLDLWPALHQAITPAAPSQPGASNLRPYPRPRPVVYEYWGFTEPAEGGAGAEVIILVPAYVGAAAAGAGASAVADLLLPPPPTYRYIGAAVADGSVRALVGVRQGLLTEDEILLLLLGDL